MRVFCYQASIKNVEINKSKGKEGRKEGRKRKEVNRSPKGLRLKERDVENGREEDCHEEERERQQRENKDNACVCVVFVTVAFWWTEGLCACVCLSVYVCVHLLPHPPNLWN